MVFRRFAVASLAFALCLLVAFAVPAAAGGSAVGCAPSCGSDAPTLHSAAHPAPETCVRNPSCGGGSALGLGTAAGIGMLAAAVPAIGPSVVGRRRRSFRRQPRLGRLLSGGLFRPPRPLLDV